jgi:5-methylcytosine-specific restriction endonuclease McrA
MYDPGDWIGCEVCDRTAVDIHHIEPRGMGGSKEKDDPANLMALCRECHMEFGDKKQFKRMLKTMHHERVRTIYQSLSSDWNV